MKIVVDVNLSPDWANLLRDAGHEAVHWSEVGARDAHDEGIVEWAERNDAIILTRDLDFGAYVVLAGRTRPSVVQVRAKRTSLERGAHLVRQALEQTAPALARGALVTIEVERVRVRLLTYPSSEQ